MTVDCVKRLSKLLQEKTSMRSPILEFKGGEVGFVDFAEAEGVGDEPFASFDFYEVFAPLPAVVEGETNGVFVIVGFKIPFTTISVTGV